MGDAYELLADMKPKTDKERIAELEAQLAELREAARTARESLMNVLCDPEGNACIDGSSGDLSVINEALALLQESVMSEQNYDQVICPDCNHQFTAVPVNVQEHIAELKEALKIAISNMPPSMRFDIEQRINRETGR